MLMPQPASTPAMWASTPRSSRWCTTTLVRSPVMSTSMPLMRRMTAAPPADGDAPHLQGAPLAALAADVHGVGVRHLGGRVPDDVHLHAGSPSPGRRRRRTRGSSVASPRMPATSALSVPWPDPVAAKEPYRVKTARSGCSPKSFRAMEARAKAPAVCELDGPTMMGPIMSLRP